jgi:hypothetical protein
MDYSIAGTQSQEPIAFPSRYHFFPDATTGALRLLCKTHIYTCELPPQ